MKLESKHRDHQVRQAVVEVKTLLARYHLAPVPADTGWRYHSQLDKTSLKKEPDSCLVE